MEETIVKEWLKSLGMEQYAISFIDNGYDDLEICKQIDAPDLDAIGVVDPAHRLTVLQAVQILKVEGAASVYFTVEEAQAATQENVSRSVNPPLPHSPAQESAKNSGTGSALSTPVDRVHIFPGISDVDAYEAGRAELVRLPQLQLRKLIQENLKKDNVNLTVHPYTTKDGDRGILEGLASRYADQFNTHFQDVLDHLEFLRSQDFSKYASTNTTKSILGSQGHLFQQKSELTDRKLELWSPRSSSSSSLDHNEDYPIYVPGKYNPSSCLSDAEEDQIYGFTGGANPSSSVPASGPGYLNPRSHCIYELPPSRRNHNGVKKKLGLGRLLKTLKRDLKKSNEIRNKPLITHTVNSTTPRPICAAPDLSSTPLVVLPGYSSPTSSHCSQSSKSHSSGQSFIVTSASAPGTPGSSGPVRDSGLQQAIERLKEQEIKRRREEQFREHEQMLEDIRHGLQQSKHLKTFGSIYAQFPLCTESSYMYDDEALTEEEAIRHVDFGANSGHSNPILLHHWYDEPPYESDPEDFLLGMSKEEQREFLSNSLRLSRDEDVISLKTAGDISLPKDIVGQSSEWVSPRHFLMLPGPSDVSSHNGLLKQQHLYISHQQQQHHLQQQQQQQQQQQHQQQQQQQQQHSRNYLQMDARPQSLSRGEGISEEASGNIAPRRGSRGVLELKGSKGQEVPFDLQSISSKLSNMSVETNLSNRRNNLSSGSEETNSGSQSELEEEERRESESLVGRMRMLQRDMEKKILCLRNSREVVAATEANGIQMNNGESLQDRLQGGYSRYQRQNSLPVKLKQVDALGHHHHYARVNDPCYGIIIGRARALVDYQPSSYDKDGLKFMKGDVIDIISKNPSGLWRGHLNGKIGHFKFILVEEIESPPTTIHYSRPTRRYGITQENQVLWFQKPGALKEILLKFNLSQLAQVFLLNGYDNIDHFREIGVEDLDHLGIVDPQLRSQVLCAVRFLQDALEEYENVTYPWDHGSSFVRHVNGRISLPVKCSQGGFYSLHETGYERGDQIYENTSGYLYPSQDENNFDNLERLEHSSSSTDTSSGYHSRPTFNIPIATTADTPTSRTEASFPCGSHGNASRKSHKVVPATTAEGELESSKDVVHNTQRDSYHAQVARVHSSPSPTLLSGAESTGGETAPSC